MAGKNTHNMMRLFGVDLPADQPAVYSFRPLASSSPAIASSGGGLFLIQNSGGKGAEVAHAAAADVDTSLGLWRGAEVSVSRTAHNATVYNAMPSQRFPQITNPELSLSLGGVLHKMSLQESEGKGSKISASDAASSSSSVLSRISAENCEQLDGVTDGKGAGVADLWMADSAPVYSPAPSRGFPANPDLSLSLGGWSPFLLPKMPFGKSGGRAVNISVTDADARSGLSPAVQRATIGKKREQKDVVTDRMKRKSVKRVRHSNPVDDQTVPSLEEFPIILIKSNNGTRPEFLYRKRLQVSDVKPDQNRLFLTKCVPVLEFLTEEERRVVAECRTGLEVSAVDPLGQSYKLHLATWPSLNMVVLNTDWRKLVHGNNAQAGCFVELWGYRQNGKLCFAANFRKPEAAETQTGAGSSGSTNGGTITA